MHEIGFQANYFATIDAHGQEITKMMMTDKGMWCAGIRPVPNRISICIRIVLVKHTFLQNIFKLQYLNK